MLTLNAWTAGHLPIITELHHIAALAEQAAQEARELVTAIGMHESSGVDFVASGK